MPKFSAGLLPFRGRPTDGSLEVFLTHMGGPFWAGQDAGAWSIAKGEYEPGDEEPRQVARREFAEEVGMTAPDGDWIDLGETRLPSGKRVQAFAVETADDLAFVASNTFTMEWPRHSGVMAEFPEVDGARWLPEDAARTKLIASQLPILDALVARWR